ncbi:MAG: pantetheine-phosphate adenylyltransferase [Gemmatimonadota bacterium]|nr:pantetheine-phosphate adenylyltransferase [Gemmatimonadota bacterium]
MSPRPERVALYPGSFDPVTLGHEDIARRALQLADRVIVAVAETATQIKRTRFTVDERLELLATSFADEPSIEVARFSGLLVDFARSTGATLVVRGLRAVSDFEYEFQMAQMNRALHAELETVFLVPNHDYDYLSSSLVREVAALGGDVTRFVAPHVLAALGNR